MRSCLIKIKVLIFRKASFILVSIFFFSQLFINPVSVYAFTLDTNLANSSASFLGEAVEDQNGTSVSFVGDVNGDGYEDFITSAQFSNTSNGSDTGKTYLIFGKASGWAMDTPLSTADASFIGEVAVDRSGWSAAGVGDVNSDGFDDFVIGAPGNDANGSASGQAYLILGKASGWTQNTNLSASSASFIGEGAQYQAGQKISAVGDVNGDGFDDFLIAGPRATGGITWIGETYLILGKASGWAMDTSLATSDASFIGETLGGGSGVALSGVGDVNNDGFDDFLLGAPCITAACTGPGEAYLILGKASGWAMNTSLSTANASFVGEVAVDAAGASVSGVGDVNRDGFDDFLIAARLNDEGGSNIGQTYLIFGKASGWAMDTNLSTANASFIGEAAGDENGTSVSSAGDVNNDGFDDFLISSLLNNAGGALSGKTYLVLGKASGWAMDTNLSASNATFIAETAGDRSGYSLSSAGDVNADGFDDLLIGATYNDAGGSNAGKTYLLLSDYVSPSVSLTSISPDPSSNTAPSIVGSVSDALSTVSSVEYQMDGTSGSWIACTADDGTFDEASEAFTCIVSPALSEGSHTIYVRTTDSAGNTTASGSYSSDIFTIDTQAPGSQGGTGDSAPFKVGSVDPEKRIENKEKLKEAGDSTITYDKREVKLYLSAKDATSDVEYMMVSQDKNFRNATWKIYDGDVKFKFGKDGKKNIYFKFKDTAGNISQVYKQVLTIDTTPPTLTIDKKIPTVSGTSEEKAYIKLYVDNILVKEYPRVLEDLTWSFPTYILPTGTHTIKVTAKDKAGNTAETSFSSIL